VRVIEHAENIDDELRNLNAKFNSRHMLSSVLIIKNLVLFLFFLFVRIILMYGIFVQLASGDVYQSSTCRFM
jgi:flagellar biogenesis protein FliO